MFRIGFTEAGVTGESATHNMMRNNLSVNIYSRTESKTDDLVVKGAVWYDTPKAAAEASDIIFTMAGFPSNAEGAYFSETGIFQVDLTGKVVVDLTTNTFILAEKIARKVTRVGAHALDSLVPGGDLGTKNDILVTMTGDDQEGYETVLPIFKTFDKTFMLHDPAGERQHTKMVNQLMIADTVTGLIEMFVYANVTGLTLEKALGTIGGGNAASWLLSDYGPRISKEDYMPGLFVKHFIKDLRIALDEAGKLDPTLLATQEATELYESFADRGFENDGTQALAKL